MTASSLTPAAAADAVDALWDRLIGVVEGLDETGWHRPVPACPGWDVHDLVGHVGGLTGMFLGMPQPEAPEGWTPPEGASPVDAITEAAAAARRGWPRERLLEELRRAGRTWAEQLRALPDLSAETMGPLGPTTQEGFVSVRFFDLWSHVVDLHAALDLPLDPAEDSLVPATCYAYTISRAPWLYGKRGGAPDGASVRLELQGPPVSVHKTLTVSGGRATFSDTPRDVTDADVIAGPTPAFALLLTGRMDRPGAEAQGLTAGGPEAERLLGTRMFG